MREVFEYTRFWATGSAEEFAFGAMHQPYADLDDAQEVGCAGVLRALHSTRTGACQPEIHHKIDNNQGLANEMAGDSTIPGSKN